MPSARPRPWAAAAAAVCALALSACSSGGGSAGASPSASAGTATPRIVASTDVYGDIAKQIAGDRVPVTSIVTSAAQDPHSFEASASDELKLSKATIVIENGGGYDDFVDTMLAATGTRPTLLDAVKISGKKAAAGGELNEHVWYDFPTVVKLADELADRLGAADPADAATFTANAKTFTGKVQQLEQRLATLEATYAGQGVAVTEPVPLYLLEAAGLVDKTPKAFSEAIEEGTDVPADALAETLALFTDKQVRLLAYNDQVTDPTTKKVAQAAKDDGIAVVPVTETLPEGTDYLGWMSDNVTAVEKALAG